MKPLPNQLAAIWLCLVSNEFYRRKLNDEFEKQALVESQGGDPDTAFADQNFLDRTGLAPATINALRQRVHRDADVQTKLTAVRAAFQSVFRPGTGSALWDDSSPDQPLIHRL